MAAVCCVASVCWQAQYGWSPPVGSTGAVASNTPANRLLSLGTLMVWGWGGGGVRRIENGATSRHLASEKLRVYYEMGHQMLQWFASSYLSRSLLDTSLPLLFLASEDRSSFILRITYPQSSVTPPLARPSGRRPPGMWRSPSRPPAVVVDLA